MPGQAVVAVAALAYDVDQPAVQQPGEVGAGGGRAHAGHPGQFPRRQGATVEQGRQDRRPRGIGDQRGDGRDVGVTSDVLHAQHANTWTFRPRSKDVVLLLPALTCFSLGPSAFAQRLADQVARSVHDRGGRAHQQVPGQGLRAGMRA